jgi:predicted Ser/Thr protein kinase
MIYTKNYKDGKPSRRRHGLSIRQTYDIELECLKRIKGYPYMCQLLDYNEEEMTLDLKWAGVTLETVFKEKLKYKGLIKEAEFIKQFNKAFEIFEKLDIVHFDIGINNICVNDGKICFIDFGRAVIDKNPKADFFKKEYDKFIKNGGYEGHKNSTLSRMLKRLY